MLAMKSYPAAYVAACRARVDGDVAAYRKQVGAKRDRDFEARFFNDQVLLLDHMFVHRLGGAEGKDGNALNEVRVLCNSLLLNDGALQIDKQPDWPTSAGSGIKLPADRSILGLKPGDRIALTEADFVRLADAFFTEIVRRYPPA